MYFETHTRYLPGGDIIRISKHEEKNTNKRHEKDNLDSAVVRSNQRKKRRKKKKARLTHPVGRLRATRATKRWVHGARMQCSTRYTTW